MDQVATHWADANVVCGNGYRDGQLLRRPAPELTSVAIDSTFVGDLVGDLVATHGSASQGGNIEYARAVKDADPTASVIGPVLWGGYSYFVTREELAQGLRLGQVNTLVADYLDEMAQAEQAGGHRLIDGLAIHFYDDRVHEGGTDALRLQSTRSLWDPSYARADWWPVRDREPISPSPNTTSEV